MNGGEHLTGEDTGYDAFISYHSADLDAATTLAEHLRNEGIVVYLDVWQTLPGDLVQETIEAALTRSTSCVVLVGPGGPGPNGFGRWQHEEVRSAIAQRVDDPGFRVIPVLFPGTGQDADILPSLLRRHSACDFRTGLDNEPELRRLTTARPSDRDRSRSPPAQCPSCATPSVSAKGWVVAQPRDVSFPVPARQVWRKRRWRCQETRRGAPRFALNAETGVLEQVVDRWHTGFVDLTGDQGLLGGVHSYLINTRGHDIRAIDTALPGRP